MKIALAQLNPTVGDLRGNGSKIIDFARRAREAAADLVAFPELSVTGYPPLDLLENALFIEGVQKALEWIAAEVPSDIGVIVGAPVPNDERRGRRLFNAARLYEGGELKEEVRKVLLPSYDIYDEDRYFEPARELKVVVWRGMRLGLHICEDMWNVEAAAHRRYEQNPIDELAQQEADLFINCSAVPFAAGKRERRTELIRTICEAHHRPFLLVNQVGANSELIFDGNSRVHRADGSMILCAPSFEEALVLWDSDVEAEPCADSYEDVEELYGALVLGIRDYFEKSGLFEKALVSLSGGIDSAVTCALAVEALGTDRVVGVTMPSPYSSRGSVHDSMVLADNLQIEFHRIPIRPAIGALDVMLGDVFSGTDQGITEENVQARIRGLAIMALSNKFQYLLLATGNKSEMAVGYATLYGDMNGGLAVLADVFKGQVYELASYINRRAVSAVIPEEIFSKAPSAELRPDQTDQDSLPPYEVLDRVLGLYIEEMLDVDAIVERTGYEERLVLDILRRVDRSEYKRRQAPPGLRVSGKAFGSGRRLPVVARWDREYVRRIIAGDGPDA